MSTGQFEPAASTAAAFSGAGQPHMVTTSPRHHVTTSPRHHVTTSPRSTANVARRRCRRHMTGLSAPRCPSACADSRRAESPTHQPRPRRVLARSDRQVRSRRRAAPRRIQPRGRSLTGGLRGAELDGSSHPRRSATPTPRAGSTGSRSPRCPRGATTPRSSTTDPRRERGRRDGHGERKLLGATEHDLAGYKHGVRALRSRSPAPGHHVAPLDRNGGRNGGRDRGPTMARRWPHDGPTMPQPEQTRSCLERESASGSALTTAPRSSRELPGLGRRHLVVVPHAAVRSSRELPGLGRRHLVVVPTPP